MPYAETNPHAIIPDFLAYAQTRLKTDAFQRACPFLEHYLDQVDYDDLSQRSASDWSSLALSHWDFIQSRVIGEPSLRMVNPSLEANGWQSAHTILEIVNDDMPFLVDSVTMELNRRGLTVHLIIHPVMRVQRDPAGQLLALYNYDHHGVGGAQYESFIHIEMDRLGEGAQRTEVLESVRKVLQDVRSACRDYSAMKAKCDHHIRTLEQGLVQYANEGEAATFLQWLKSDNFTFLGYRECDLVKEDNQVVLRARPDSELGILTCPGHQANVIVLADAAQAALSAQGVVFITQSNTHSTVHRAAHLDYIGIKRLDEHGKMVGEAHFLGLFTSLAVHEHPDQVPLLREKVHNVVRRAGLLQGSHIHKVLNSILENYPRQDLFQMTEDELFSISTGILKLQERQRIRLFLRRDTLSRFYTCLVFLPRDKFNTIVRLKIQGQLEHYLQGKVVEFSPSLTDSVLARLYFVVRTYQEVEVDVRRIEQALAQTIRGWEDDFAAGLVERLGEAVGSMRAKEWTALLPASYREQYTPEEALADIDSLEALTDDNPLGVSLYLKHEGGVDDSLRFKLFQSGAPIPLYKSLPMLERMGVEVLDEYPFTLHTPVGDRFLHDLGLRLKCDVLDLMSRRTIFHTLFKKVWEGEVESDDFNQLSLVAGLEWRQIVVFRAYAKYLRQLGFNFSQSYIEQTLVSYPYLASSLWTLFDLRFNPQLSAHRSVAIEQQVATIQKALEDIANLDQDRILRQYLGLIQATLRTNFYQQSDLGEAKPYLSFKLNPSAIPGMPEPKPMFEIFVYSPRVEGVHLRGGKVARGGLRWSDRREDFRTEVLGLMKAQMVKNTVIVPVGSKGGFVLKQAPSPQDREAFLKEGIECYQTFLKGLLDLTDNLIKGTVVPPIDVVRHDEDDPYLVVAADKGTATFSDYANAIADEYGFWLGDAFASGGSVGYDHKKMGITARGAWESVKRHFRAQSLDTQTTPFTVVGVGDMSGDVFGNGMLLSPHIRLLAAFDHRHIFIDPNPDCALTFIERQRMFNLPRSSWADYRTELISAGGGIYARSDKHIDLSPQAQAVLGVEIGRLTPNELMKVILQAPVDLLYNGGIGTYVKATFESNNQVGDRANDAIRVNGNELRAKVVAEGGNLGCTQYGRIEFALKGGAIYTDAIDNSAGVDCSDHEVNIKILVNRLQEARKLTQETRNQLLAEMTDEVGHLVLKDNYYQTQCVSLMVAQKDTFLEAQALWMSQLESKGRLNRTIENLPSQAELEDRQSKHLGLTTPEHAVLMAYTKMALFDEVLASRLPDDAAFQSLLHNYFPKPLQDRFSADLDEHPLRREIITTALVNQMVNRVGSTFIFRIQQVSPSSATSTVIAAYRVVKEALRLDAVWESIDKLDNIVADALQMEMLRSIADVLYDVTVWLLRRHPEGIMLNEHAQRYQFVFDRLQEQWVSLLPMGQRAAYQAEVDRLRERSVPQVLAETIAIFPYLTPVLDLVQHAGDQLPVERVTSLYFALGEQLHFTWAQQSVESWIAENQWQEQAKKTLLDQLAHTQREITVSLLDKSSNQQDNSVLLTQWQQTRQTQLRDYQQLVLALQVHPSLDLSMLTVLVHGLNRLL